MTSTPPRPPMPIDRLNRNARLLLGAAQQEAERRGGTVVDSGLVLLSVASAEDQLSQVLLRALGTDLVSLRSAVDAQWSEVSPWLLDQPISLVNAAMTAAVERVPASDEAGIEMLLTVLLEFNDSMASRLVTRLGGEPTTVARALLASR